MGTSLAPLNPCRPTVSAIAWLHPDWMPGDITAGIAAVVVPTRADVAAPPQVGGVETQTGDDGESVARAGINCHPPSAAPFAKAHEIAGGQGRAEHAAAM